MTQSLTWNQAHQIIIQHLGAVIEPGALLRRNCKSCVIEQHPVGIMLEDLLFFFLQFGLVESTLLKGQRRMKIVQCGQVALVEGCLVGANGGQVWRSLNTPGSATRQSLSYSRYPTFRGERKIPTLRIVDDDDCIRLRFRNSYQAPLIYVSPPSGESNTPEPPAFPSNQLVRRLLLGRSSEHSGMHGLLTAPRRMQAKVGTILFLMLGMFPFTLDLKDLWLYYSN